MSFDSKGYVYFIQAAGGGLIKIGFSINYPDYRLRDLQIGSPVLLERLAYIYRYRMYEGHLHEIFARFWSHGEWFHPADDLMRFIRLRATPWLPLGPDHPDPSEDLEMRAIHAETRRHRRGEALELVACQRREEAMEAARVIVNRSRRSEATNNAEMAYSRVMRRVSLLKIWLPPGTEILDVEIAT